MNYAVFILTHGRPKKQLTLRTLQSAGYVGPLYFIVDDEDEAMNEYKDLYGNNVIVFSKKEYEHIDIGDNFKGRKGVIYARNASFDIAKKLGIKYFFQFDDDYTEFCIRYHPTTGEYLYVKIRKNINMLFEALVEFMTSTGSASICLSQGGDHIGGQQKTITVKRKAMNTFLMNTDRVFTFPGRINEDVNAYCLHAQRGLMFFTVMTVAIKQVQTQKTGKGMTDLYRENGTYIKSFYTVMMHPSGASIGVLEDGRGLESDVRMHHSLKWDLIAPKILHSRWKR